jgi:hypothetical protein
LDEWLLRNLHETRRFGFFPGGNQQAELEKQFPALAHDLPLGHGDLFTDGVKVDRDWHECDKLQKLFNCIVGQDMKLPNPVLSLSGQKSGRVRADLLDSMAIDAKQYAIVAPVSKSSTHLKALTVEQALVLIDRLYFEHGLMSVLIGNLKEKPELDKIADSANKSAKVATVWIGQARSLVELLHLTASAKIYAGCDTGPMHFAAALGIPVLSIFGGGTFPRFLPRAAHAAALTQNLPCFGCDWMCPFDRSLCIELVNNKSIEASLDTLLNKPNGVIVDHGCASVADSAAFVREFALSPLRNFSQLKIEHSRMQANYQRIDADRELRGVQIDTLSGMLKESDADRAARGEQITSLTDMLRAAQADSAARGTQIDTLSGLLKESDADRAARGEQMSALTQLLKESEADRLARWGQIVTLTTLVHEMQNKSPVIPTP